MKSPKIRSATRGHVNPTTNELLEFGQHHCHVDRPHVILERIAESMSNASNSSDERIPVETKKSILEFW